MDCIIVDDDKHSREAIKKLISQVDFLDLKGDFDEALQAFDYLQHESVDLAFVESGRVGKDFCEQISHLEHHAILILFSSQENFSLNSLENLNGEFLINPVLPGIFHSRVHKAKEIYDSSLSKSENEDKEFLFVRNKSIITKINIQDILYIHALGDYVIVNTAGNQHVAHITMCGIERKLPEGRFCRIHRSYIIALRHIDNIEEGTVFIQKHPIPVGEQYKSVLLKMIDFI